MPRAASDLPARCVLWRVLITGFTLAVMLLQAPCGAQQTVPVGWSNRSERPPARNSADNTATIQASEFRRGFLQWKSPTSSRFSVPAMTTGHTSSNQKAVAHRTGTLPFDAEHNEPEVEAREGAFRQSVQRLLAKRSPKERQQVGLVSAARPGDRKASMASPLPATPWEEDLRPASPATDDPFQDPFQDRTARQTQRLPSGVQVRFKLEEPQTVTAGFQKLEDLLLDEPVQQAPAEEPTTPNTEFQPAVPPQDRDTEPPGVDAREMDRPVQPFPDMDDISPFQPEATQPEAATPQEIVLPLEPTAPEMQDDGLRLPEDTERRQTLPGESLQPPPLPGQDTAPQRQPGEDGLPELRFRDELDQPRVAPQEEEQYELGQAEEGDGEDQLPCDRKYRDRNCCQEEARCKRVIQAAQNRVIQNISLDIAPPFELDERGLPTDEDKQEKLAKIPSRTWMSRDNQVLATGSLTDLRGGKLLVSSDDGIDQSIPLESLSLDDLCFVTAHWRLPAECPLPGDTHALRDFTMITYTWTASALCHKPLYFENVALERYGHSAGPVRQPLLSAAHFFGSVILLPYNVKLYPPTECRYALGYYQPGDCAPWMIHAFPLSKRAALSELSFALGLWGFIN